MSQLAPVIVVEARKEGGWRVAVRARTGLESATPPVHGVYLWQRVATTMVGVHMFLESAATFRNKMLYRESTK